MNNFKKLIPYAKRYKSLIILGYFLIICSITLAMINPYISKNIIDKVVMGKHYNLLLKFLLTLLSISLVRGLIRYSQSYIFETVSQRLIFDFRNQLYSFLQKQSFEFYDKTRTGELMARLTGDLEGIRMFFVAALPMLFENLFYFVIALIIMFTMNVKLTLAILLTSPFILVGAYFFDKTIRPEFRKNREKYSNLNTATQENITGIRVVKAYSQEDYEIEKFSSVNTEYMEQNINIGLIWGKFFPILEAASSISTLVIFIYGGYLVINNSISLGTLFAFQGYIWMIMGPLRSVGWAINLIERANASSERVFGLLYTPIKINDGKSDHKVQNGSVQFKNVYFKHYGKDILKDINIDVKPGMKVAIMGETGSGKTSIVNLIARYYDCYKGQVLVDGVDVKEYKLKNLREAVSIVPQETFLFSDTIANNIAYGVPNASLEEIIEAAKIACAHEFIVELPDGYDTLVGERGIGLSGGQKQRIAIARALLKKSKIIILDDSTSAVDMETEYIIQKSLDQYFVNSTVFIIAHRISSVKNCDVIYFIEDGQIVEQGNHDELLAKKGRYYNIYIEQYKEFSKNKEGDE
ncbi:ABC transporter ATP-binding protein [Caldicellulosiruptoraceae bacterium PP1]